MQHLRRKSVVRKNQETWDYQARVLAAGGTIQAATLNAVDAFVDNTKASGVWQLLVDVGVFAGDQLTAALVKLKYPNGVQSTLTNIGFLNGDYAVNTGLIGRGAQYLRTGVAAPGATGALGFYVRTPVNSGMLMGSSAGAAFDDVHLFRDAAASEFAWGDDLPSDTPFAQAMVASRQTGVGTFVYQNGNQVAFMAPAGAVAVNNLEIYLFAKNISGGAAQFFQGRSCFYCIANALSTAQAGALSNEVYALQLALNRT